MVLPKATVSMSLILLLVAANGLAVDDRQSGKKPTFEYAVLKITMNRTQPKDAEKPMFHAFILFQRNPASAFSVEHEGGNVLEVRAKAVEKFFEFVKPPKGESATNNYEWINVLNALGQEGWELVCVREDKLQLGNVSDTIYLFKRQQ